ncbi:MAG TPA: CPBP family intramembrane glutamic endopeptidase [Candidatus Saccharimonadales bacterium]|nr:CPBP family intramembrane glutamic endopeptidase [Candidatus Saccharimonadales bacterium]
MKTKLNLFKGRDRADLGGPYWLIFNTLVIFFFSQILAAFIVELILSIMHPHINVAGLLDNSSAGQFFYVILAEGLAVALVLLSLKNRRLPPRFIGLGRRPIWDDVFKALIGFTVFYGLLIVASLLVSVFLPNVNTNQQQDLGFNNITTTTDNLLAFAALVIVPPLGEEPLVRGYLFSGLRARLKFWPAAIVTSILFGIAHLEIGGGAPLLWAAGIDTFVLSLVLVYLRESTGALYAGILVHMLNNLVAFGVHFH